MSGRRGVFKKGRTFRNAATDALDDMSKAALLDCLLDALSAQYGVNADEVTVGMVAEF